MVKIYSTSNSTLNMTYENFLQQVNLAEQLTSSDFGVSTGLISQGSSHKVLPRSPESQLRLLNKRVTSTAPVIMTQWSRSKRDQVKETKYGVKETWYKWSESCCHLSFCTSLFLQHSHHVFQLFFHGACCDVCVCTRAPSLWKQQKQHKNSRSREYERR